jgi:hypothetical protein
MGLSFVKSGYNPSQPVPDVCIVLPKETLIAARTEALWACLRLGVEEAGVEKDTARATAMSQFQSRRPLAFDLGAR